MPIDFDDPFAAINTNGFLLTRDLVVELGRAGLCWPSTRPSTSGQHRARRGPDEALEVAQTALAYGAKVALLRNSRGTVAQPGREVAQAHRRISRLAGRRPGRG